MSNRITAILLMIGMAVGCVSEPNAPEDPDSDVTLADWDRDVTFKALAAGSTSGLIGTDDEQLSMPTLFVIHDAGEWSDFWERHVRPFYYSSSHPVPTVNFDAQTVLALVDVCHPHVRSIEIARVVSTDGVLRVHAVRPTVDGEWHAVSQPYHFVAIDGVNWDEAKLEVTEE